MNTLDELRKDLKFLKKIVIFFAVLSVFLAFWYKDDLPNLIGALFFTGFFIAIGILGWRDTARAIKWYKKQEEINVL